MAGSSGCAIAWRALKAARSFGLRLRMAEGSAALLRVVRDHEAGRGVEAEGARLGGRDEAVLDDRRHRADRAMAAHGQTPRGLDEEEADVAVGAGRGVEDGARHHVVAARLEHEAGADPVEASEEVLPALEHGGALEDGHRAAGDPDGVPAGVAVDAEEGRAGHGWGPGC